MFFCAFNILCCLPFQFFLSLAQSLTIWMFWLVSCDRHTRNMILCQSINDYSSPVQLQNIPFVVVNNPWKFACYLETRTSCCTSAGIEHYFFPFFLKIWISHYKYVEHIDFIRQLVYISHENNLKKDSNKTMAMAATYIYKVQHKSIRTWIWYCA